MRRLILGLALLLAPALAQGETCTFASGASTWSAVGTIAGAGVTGCTASAGDHFIVASGAVVTVTGAITQDTTASIGITVQSGGSLSVVVSESVNSGNGLTLTLGDLGLDCAEGSTCTLTGGFRSFGVTPAVVLSDFSRTAFHTVGDLTEASLPAGSTATISYPTTSADGQDYDSANGVDGDSYLSTSLTDINATAGNSDVLCFFDPAPTDEYVPPDVSACYKVTAIDGNPTGGMSIGVSVRQGAIDSGWTLARRDIIAGTLGAAIVPGQSTGINVGAAFADSTAAADAIGRWIRFENGTSAWMLSHAYRIMAATDNGSNDTVTLVDLRGVEEAHAAGDAWRMDLQGWGVGDPFFVMVPVRLTSATAATTDSPVLLNGTVSVRGTLFDGTSHVNVGRTAGAAAVATTAITEFRDVWILDPDNSTSSALLWQAPSLATIERLGITGNMTGNTTHGVAAYKSVSITDSLVRFHGDDCHSTPADDVAMTITRARCECKNATGGNSTNLIGNNGQAGVTLVVNGGSVVRGATVDYSGGILACGAATSPCTLSDTTSIGGSAQIVGGATTYKYTVTASNIALYGSTGAASGSDALAISGNVNHFILRSASIAYGDFIGGEGAAQRNGLIIDASSTASGLGGVRASAGATLENVGFVNVNHSDAASSAILRWSSPPSAVVSMKRISLVWNPRALTIGWSNAIQSTGTWAGEGRITFDSLLVSGFHDFAGTRNVAALRGNQKEFWTDNVWVGTQCFFGNETDFSLGSGTVDPTPFVEIRDRSLGLVSPVSVQTASGTVVAGLAGCGIAGGAQAPGLSKLTWGQKVNRLPIERASSASSGGGGWLPRAF